MKRLLILLLCLASSVPAMADLGDEIFIGRSSYTITSDTGVAITTFPGNVFVGVTIGSATTGAFITLWDSQGSTGGSNKILGTFDMGTVGNYPVGPFGVRISSGITYSITGTGNKNGVSIQWLKIYPLSSNN